MELEIEMELNKETKNTFRYDSNQAGEPPASKNIYIQKWAFSEEPPETITVSIES